MIKHTFSEHKTVWKQFADFCCCCWHLQGLCWHREHRFNGFKSSNSTKKPTKNTQRPVRLCLPVCTPSDNAFPVLSPCASQCASFASATGIEWCLFDLTVEHRVRDLLRWTLRVRASFVCKRTLPPSGAERILFSAQHESWRLIQNFLLKYVCSFISNVKSKNVIIIQKKWK